MLTQITPEMSGCRQSSVSAKPAVDERIGLDAAIEVRAVYGSLNTGQLFNWNLATQTSMNSVP